MDATYIPAQYLQLAKDHRSRQHYYLRHLDKKDISFPIPSKMSIYIKQIGRTAQSAEQIHSRTKLTKSDRQ